MQRRSPSERPDGPLGNSLDLDIADDMPLLHAHLVDRTWDDGGDRCTSTLLVFAEDGLWKGCLHDREEKATLWASGGTIRGVMEALEALLSEGHGMWRRDKVWSPGKGRKGG